MSNVTQPLIESDQNTTQNSSEARAQNTTQNRPGQEHDQNSETTETNLETAPKTTFRQEMSSFGVYFCLWVHLLSECIIFPMRKFRPDIFEPHDPLLIQLIINIACFIPFAIFHGVIIYANRGNLFWNTRAPIILSVIGLILLIVADAIAIHDNPDSNEFQLWINIFGYFQHIFTFTYFYGPQNLNTEGRTGLFWFIAVSIILSVLFSAGFFFLSLYIERFLSDDVDDAASPSFLAEICLLVQIINLSLNYYGCAVEKDYFDDIDKKSILFWTLLSGLFKDINKPEAATIINSGKQTNWYQEISSFGVYSCLFLHLLSECIIFPMRKFRPDIFEPCDPLFIQLIINAVLIFFSAIFHGVIICTNRDSLIWNARVPIILSVLGFILLIVADGIAIRNNPDSNEFQLWINICGYLQHIFTFTYFYKPQNLNTKGRTGLFCLIAISLVLSVLFSLGVFLSLYIERFLSDNFDDATSPEFLAEICLLVQIINLSLNYYDCAVEKDYFDHIKKKEWIFVCIIFLGGIACALYGSFLGGAFSK